MNDSFVLDNSFINFSIKILARAIVCEDSLLKGDITVSSGCVVHPRASIIAESGPIILGENCIGNFCPSNKKVKIRIILIFVIVEEYAKIIHRVPKNHSSYSENPETLPVLIIGCNNIFEVGCTVEALKIGEKNIFECKSYVSADVTVSNSCVIGAGCHLTGEHDLKENTVIYGNRCQQREALDTKGVSFYEYIINIVLYSFLLNIF